MSDPTRIEKAGYPFGTRRPLVEKASLPACAINLLMLRDKLPMSLTLEKEERFCVRFADRMRELTLTKQYRGIWTHVPNEGKRHRFTAMIMKAMGLIPGATDYFFITAHAGAVIEVKLHPNKLSDNQIRYRDWCLENNVKWACHTAQADTLEASNQTIASIEANLRQWGMLS